MIDEVVNIVSDFFYHTFDDFRKNRSKHRNNHVKMKKMREDYAARTFKTNMKI